MITPTKDLVARITIRIEAPAGKIWDGLTNPDMIRQYFFGTEAVSDWQVGSSLIFRGEWEGKRYEDKGTILQSHPPVLFQYNYWSSMSGTEDAPHNYATVTYQLESQDHATLLTIIQDNIATEAQKEHSEQNWLFVLNQLKEMLENKAEGSTQTLN